MNKATFKKCPKCGENSLKLCEADEVRGLFPEYEGGDFMWCASCNRVFHDTEVDK